MRWWQAPWAALALVALAGCSASTTEMSGTITFDGEPVKEGAINVVPLDGKGQSAGGAIKDGHYTVADAPLGEVKITITATDFKNILEKKKLYDMPDSPERVRYGQLLPKKYNDESELRYLVTPGANKKDFELTSK
jgi:hypothetical protein